MKRLNTVSQTLYNGLIRVKSDDPATRTLGETLVILLGLIFGIAVFIALIKQASEGATDLPAIFAIGWILPAYGMIRRGYIIAGQAWMLLGISGFIFVTAAADSHSHSDFSLLLDYMLPLAVTPALAALLICPRLAMVTAVANCAVITILYGFWENVHSQFQNSSDVATGLFAPVVIHFVLGIICALLAERLRQAKQGFDNQTVMLNAIFQKLPVGIAVYNLTDKIPVYYNPAFETFTSATNPEALIKVKREPHNIKESDNLALPPLPASEWPWQTALRKGKYDEFNARIEHPDGRIVDLYEQTSPILDAKTASLLYTLYVVTDVSEERKLRETISKLFRETEEQLNLVRESNKRLTELDRLKGEFLANVSHELRTPLSIILAHTEVLKVSQPAASPIIKNIEAIYEATLHLRRLVNDILDAAKLDSNQMLLDMRLIDIREPVQAAAKAIEVLVGQKQLRLVVLLPEQPVMVMGDERRLAQIALNLLSNAVKFTARGTVSIQVAPCQKEQVVWFLVQDTGIGIEPDLQSYLFERFVQIRPVSGKRNGTGIGLSIARSLARLHGGDVLLNKSVPNQGSTFVCKIPLAPINEIDPAALLPDAVPSSATKPL